jgi:hypothetical protein
MAPDECLGSVQVVPVLCCQNQIEFSGMQKARAATEQDVPKLGVGSSSWAGRENRTAAISATPMNLWRSDGC